jgi:hypothetical protein
VWGGVGTWRIPPSIRRDGRGMVASPRGSDVGGGGLGTGAVAYGSGPTKANSRRRAVWRALDGSRELWSQRAARAPRRRSPDRPAPRDEAPHRGSEPRGKAACWRPWKGGIVDTSHEAASRRPFPQLPILLVEPRPLGRGDPGSLASGNPAPIGDQCTRRKSGAPDRLPFAFVGPDPYATAPVTNPPSEIVEKSWGYRVPGGVGLMSGCTDSGRVTNPPPHGI